MRVPPNPLAQSSPDSIQPSETAMAMAATIERTRMDAISRFERPNIKADVPSYDKLKLEEKLMEEQQRKSKDDFEHERPVFKDKGAGKI